MKHTVKSYAKINLFLHITGKRNDGYHLLESLFYFPKIYDEITILESKTNDVELFFEGEFATNFGAKENNLIYLAHKILQKEFPTRIPNLRYILTKNLPISSGIGGGSANAAAVLNALNSIFKLGMNKAELAEYGVQLGADVPPCIYSSPCFVGGIGEKIIEIPKFAELSVLLVNQLIPVSTPAIFKMGFKNFSDSLENDLLNNQELFKKYNTLIEYLKSKNNDLEKNAKIINPEIEPLINLIAGQKGCDLARMSGSGGTCFGIFESTKLAKKAADNIKKLHPKWWVEYD